LLVYNASIEICTLFGGKKVNRLKELIDSLDMSAEEFAKLFGINRSSVYRYTGANKKEERDLPATLAVKIATKFNVSLDWLMGSPNAERYRDNTINALVEIYSSLTDEGKKELFSYAAYIRGKEKNNG
jgi:transcriptional regulator with XRE-family HTH domain